MKNLGLPYSCLVGDSGTIKLHSREVTEDILNNENGLGKGVSIPEGMKDPSYRILIVSSKFQTGYDEPLLQSMFVDKKLNGVQCVQTLSRLNRVTRGKTDTFVLDFVNDTDEIVESFQPFFTTTVMVGETDPNKLYDVETKIKSFNLFTQYEVDDFCKLFYDDKETDEQLQPILNRVVNKWKEIDNQEQKEEFKSHIQSYVRLYGYISQIISFEDIELEKLYIFLKYVNKKLPKEESERLKISDSIDLDSLRIQKIGEHQLSLEDKQGEIEPFSPDGSNGMVEEPMDFLSEILKKINTVFGSDLSEEHKLNLKRVTKQVYSSDDLSKVMEGDNSEQNKRKKLEEITKQVLLGYVNDQFDFYKKMENPQLINLLTNELYKNYSNKGLY
jgi:type I restriction enzyme R subunit